MFRRCAKWLRRKQNGIDTDPTKTGDLCLNENVPECSAHRGFRACRGRQSDGYTYAFELGPQRCRSTIAIPNAEAQPGPLTIGPNN